MLGDVLSLVWMYVDVYTFGIPLAVWCITHFLIWKGYLLSKDNTPYGIYGFPLLGAVPYFALSKKGLFEKLQTYVKKYGSVIRFRMGIREMVVISGTKAVKEALLNDDLLGRPPQKKGNNIEELFAFDSLITLENDLWKKHRRFSLITLRDLGFGKTPVMEEKIQEEIREVNQLIEKQGGELFDINELLVSSASNNVSTLIYGERLPHNSRKRTEIYELLSSLNSESGKVFPLAFIPFLGKIMQRFNLGVVGRLTDIMKRFDNFQRTAIEDHQKNLDRENPRDYLDHYLVEQEKDLDFNEELLKGNCLIFFFAGSGTVRVTVEYLVHLMAHFPEIQRKVQKEIDIVTGRSREVTWADNAELVYSMAVIAERHRYFPVSPSGVPRRALRTTQVAGYHIAAHQRVVLNLDSVFFDPEQFPNPYDFRPERFINENGELVNTEKVWAFSIGKRACPGESLAVLEVFLYFTRLLQDFNIVADEPVKFRPLRTLMSDTIRQNLRFIKRE